jgi:hypothetical protein
MQKRTEPRRVTVFNDPVGAATAEFPPHRPLHIYRQALDLASCPGAVTYGPQLKFLEGGDCCPRGHPGSISSFSGRAQIRPSTSIVSRAYHQDYAQYMRSRGKLYATRLVGAPVAGTNYLVDCSPVSPATAQPVSFTDSSMYRGSASNCCAGRTEPCPLSCNLTVYKPSNAKFAVQGGVSSGTRLDRLKQDLRTVVANPLKPGLKQSVKAC